MIRGSSVSVRLFAVVALFAMVTSLFACSKPKPPTITPKEVKVVAISNTGIELDVTFSAKNPNGIDLDAESVKATLAFDDGLELGKTSSNKAIHLPAKKTVDLHVPLSVKWKNVAALAPYALKEQVSYTVKGDVKMGGALSISVPFTIKGILTRAELTKLAMSAIPGIPGLPIPQ